MDTDHDDQGNTSDADDDGDGVPDGADDCTLTGDTTPIDTDRDDEVQAPPRTRCS